MISAFMDASVHRDLKILTDFGDAAVLLPLSVVFAVWLFVTSRIGTGLLWLLMLVLCNALLGLLKLYFLSCPAGAEFHSPSGHTGFGIFVYGSVTAALALATRRRWLRAAIAAVGTALIIGMAVSRYMLGNHSILEVTIGAIIGGGSLAIFVPVFLRGPSRRGPVVVMALAALIVAAIFHGQQMTAEGYLRHLGWEMGLGGAACGFR